MKTENKRNNNVITTDRLEVRGKTIVFDNTVIQISNVSAVEVGEFEKNFPQIIWWLAIGGVLIFAFVRDLWFISLILLGIAGILLYMWFNYHMFGLIIRLNSGDTKLIKSQDVDFLKDVVFVLRNIMDSEEDRSITFNLDQRTIVDNVSGSNVVLGDVVGDVVNRL